MKNLGWFLGGAAVVSVVYGFYYQQQQIQKLNQAVQLLSAKKANQVGFKLPK